MNRGAPAVAVVIAAHDPGPYLRATLDSLLAQELSAWECVVVDDGSTQDLAWVAAVDPRVRLRRQPNRGVHAARNAGAAVTTAPLLAFLDHDDLWRPGYLRAQVGQFDDPAVELASTGFDIIDSEGTVIGPGFAGYNASYAELLRGCGLHCGTVAVRRSAFVRAGGFRAYSISQDWDLWLRVLRDGAGLARTDEVLGSWRQHGGNASRDYRGLWREGRSILRQHAHPAARSGRRRLRHVAGTQAFDAARAARGAVARCRHLSWALAHAPGYTMRALWRPATRTSARGAEPPAPSNPHSAPNQP